MRIAIIDADLIGRKRHRFPNLVCMKLSAYYKEKGNEVRLVTSYDSINEYDKVFISKVFTDTPIDESVLTLPNVEYGGTGFFFDKAPNLPYEIEHHMPDYHLYDDFVNELMANGTPRNEVKEYLDYSIGYLTRGCFRKCSFCVIKKYDRAEVHSSLSEFYDPSRPKLCFLDDNFFSHPKWQELLTEVISIGKPFKFKQGLDERLLTDDKVKLLCAGKYDGDITFAFDNIKDYNLIKKKLELLRKYNDKQHKFYVLVGFDRQGNWDEAFYLQDIKDAFERIKLLMEYKCLPYIMRFEKYKDSPYRGIYITLARWCNHPSFFKKKSFKEFCEMKGCGDSPMRYLNHLLDENPQVFDEYVNMKWSDNPQR